MRIEARDRETRARDAEIALQGLGGDASRRHDVGAAQGGNRFGKRAMDRHGHDAQGRTDQHHHRNHPAGQLGEEFGMAGMRKSRRVKRLFLNGVGHDRGGAAGANEIDRADDRADDRAGIAAIGLPRHDRPGKRDRQHRQRATERSAGFLGRGDGADGHAQSDRFGELGEALRIVEDEEGRQASRRPLGPCLHSNLAADAGGLSHGERERQLHPRTSK